jgi:hypothetical protein
LYSQIRPEPHISSEVQLLPLPDEGWAGADGDPDELLLHM